MTRPPVTKSESDLYSFKPMDTNNIPDVNQSLFPNGRLKVPYIMVVCGSASGCRLWHTEGFVVYTESPELIYPTSYSLPWNKTMGESCIKKERNSPVCENWSGILSQQKIWKRRRNPHLSCVFVDSRPDGAFLSLLWWGLPCQRRGIEELISAPGVANCF